MEDPKEQAATPPPAGQKLPSKAHQPLESPDDYSKHEIRSRNEILFILRALIEAGSLITVYFNQGNDFLLTSLLEISADGTTLVLDVGSTSEMNRRALLADKLICVTSHRSVKIQFSLDGVDPVKFQERKAFLGNVPPTLARLQLRDFFRLATQRTDPLKCLIPVMKEDGATVKIEATIMDISGGGVALILPYDDTYFEIGKEFPNCSFTLPGVGNIVATLRVLKLFDETMANGRVRKRAGCQFFKLPSQMTTLIQRYIIKVEAERRARELGFS